MAEIERAKLYTDKEWLREHFKGIMDKYFLEGEERERFIDLMLEAKKKVYELEVRYANNLPNSMGDEELLKLKEQARMDAAPQAILKAMSI